MRHHTASSGFLHSVQHVTKMVFSFRADSDTFGLELLTGKVLYCLFKLQKLSFFKCFFFRFSLHHNYNDGSPSLFELLFHSVKGRRV